MWIFPNTNISRYNYPIFLLRKLSHPNNIVCICCELFF